MKLEYINLEYLKDKVQHHRHYLEMGKIGLLQYLEVIELLDLTTFFLENQGFGENRYKDEVE